MASSGSRPIYFLINIHGLTVFDIRFSSFAPSTDSVLLGGLVHAISTFSDSVMDNISTESGTLNVIERQGKKIMFDNGKEVEAILVADKESMILMEKVRTIIDIFEENFLQALQESNQVIKEVYTDFSELTRKYFLTALDENVIFRLEGDPSKLASGLRLPSKWVPLYECFDGLKSVIDVSREMRWPSSYVFSRTAMFKELGVLKPVDISIRGTDLFLIDDAFLSGILLEQGTAYRTIKKTWDDWGVRLTQALDGRNTISALSAKFAGTSELKKKFPHFLRWLSLQGYISPLTDSDLVVIVFEEFLTILRYHLNNALGDMVAFDMFEVILNLDSSKAKEKGRSLSVAKLVEQSIRSFHYEKLLSIMKSRSEIITPLFQQAFLPFLDNILRVMTTVLGKKVALEFLQLAIIDTESRYGKLIYDVLFTD